MYIQACEHFGCGLGEGREGWTGPRERENNDCIEKGGRGGVHVRSKTEGDSYYENVYAC